MKMEGRSSAGNFMLAQMDTLEAEKKEAKHTQPPSVKKAFTVAAAPAPRHRPKKEDDKKR